MVFFVSLLPLATRAFSTADLSAGENVVVPLIANSLEFTLSSPPPLHQFEEPPLIVETEHLDLNPGKEVEEVLAAQGHEVTDIVGKEKWVLNDPALYEGLIPQNSEWTEFVDENTGEWVYLDEYGSRVEKPEM
jgi:heme/copper-type cytochrome/quinol oxidase subunit 1